MNHHSAEIIVSLNPNFIKLKKKINQIYFVSDEHKVTFKIY